MNLIEAKSKIDKLLAGGKDRGDIAGDVFGWELLEADLTATIEYLKNTEADDYLEDTDSYTQAGFAQFINRDLGGKVKFDHRRNRWLRFTGNYYIEDTDGNIYRLAMKAIRRRFHDTVKIQDLKERELDAKACIDAERRANVEAILGLAKVFKPIADSGIDFDSDPWLLAAFNGIVDLKTGLLRDGKPEDRITQHSTVSYYTDAAKPERWLQFLNEIFSNDQQLINWIWRALGYSLTGSCREQIVFMLYGTGANGKSKFLDILRHILGDYGYNSPFATFELDARASIPSDLAALDKRRFVTSLETNDGSRLNEARIKALSGEDTITARFLHQEFFSFKPVAKIWLGLNHKPRVSDDSYGFWRRVRLVPFLKQFKGAEADNNLFEKLVAESESILKWLVDGCLEYQRVGLGDIPDAISGSTREYQSESDPLGQFLEEVNIFGDAEHVLSSEAYAKYLVWTEQQHMQKKEVLSNTAFGRRMTTKFTKKHTSKGKIFINNDFPKPQKMTGFSCVNDGLGVDSELIPIMNPRVENKCAFAVKPVIPVIYDILPDACPTCGHTQFSPNEEGYICRKCAGMEV